MSSKKYLFTSESVTEGHPDKVCDQISDAILDNFLVKHPQARVAAETTVTTGMALVCGEITADCYVDIPHIVRETIKNIGNRSAMCTESPIPTKETTNESSIHLVGVDA